MPTLFLNCVLFTLKDTPVSENKYVQIFNIWISKLIQNGGLTKDDFLLISIDERTMEHIKKSPGCLGALISKLQCPYAFKIFPAPDTILDGMKIRYTVHEFTHDAYMYMDIDVLVMKSLKTLPLEPGNLYVMAEGSLADPNYGADMSSKAGVGYTSAIMIFTAPSIQKFLFESVQRFYKDMGYYTIDQPFFNKAVYMMMHDSSLTKYVSYNGQSYSKGDTVFLNCGGDVGDGLKHKDKIDDVICMINVGLF
jgi:hypothetical protein